MKNTKFYINWFVKTLALLMTVTMFAAPVVVLADTPQATTDISDIADKVNNELNEIEAKIAGTAWAVIPIALLVAVIGMCLTHDSKKVAILLKVCGSILAAAAAILLITKDYAILVIENFVEKLF